MNVKALVFDLDETLLTSDKDISEITVSTIQKCREQGILIAFATSRSEGSSLRFIDKIQPDVVISNGGALFKIGDEIISQKRIDKDVAQQIINKLMIHDTIDSVTFDTQSGYYVSWDEARSKDYSHGNRYDFTKPLHEEPYKITIETSDMKLMEEIKSTYACINLLKFTGGDFYRIAHKHAIKGITVKEMANHFKIPIENVVAFGDDFNDIEMIRDVGVGVAMGNAIDEVKAVCDEICDTNDNDGIAKWILENIQL